MISIIIPTYNRAEFLGQAIESVLRQTYHDFEIIVVDDGSADKTRDVVAAFSDRIRYFYQENAGIASARNKGIAESKGEYIAFLDSDDFWPDDSLEKRMEGFSINPEAGLVYGAYQRFEGEFELSLGQSSACSESCSSGYIYKELLMRCFISTITAIIPKKVFNRVGNFDESFERGEDYDLWLRIAREFEVVGIGALVAFYRQHEQNVMKGDRLCNVPSEVSVVRECIRRDPSALKGISWFSWQRRLSGPYFDLAYESFHQQQWERSGFFIRSALKIFPFRGVYWKYLALAFLYRWDFFEKFCFKNFSDDC